MKGIKILGEDRCHIVLMEAILQKTGIRIRTEKLISKGNVLPKLEEQLRLQDDRSVFFDGELIIVDEDRVKIDLPKIRNTAGQLLWKNYTLVLTPNNCEGFLLFWLGIDCKSPKSKFKEVKNDYNYSDDGAFIRYIVNELVNWNNLPKLLNSLLNFLHSLGN